MRQHPFVLALSIGPLVGSLALAGCGRAPEAVEAAPEKAPSTDHAAIKPLAQKKFGGAITEKTTTALDVLLREPARFQAKTVRTEGVVSAVCKAMGCWMEIADTAGQAHIRMAGHSFFVPRDASGHRAVVQGTVIRANDDECSEEAKQQTGAVAKIEIEATGVEFVD
jgi:Domain of unknown function (DUF4920)